MHGGKPLEWARAGPTPRGSPSSRKELPGAAQRHLGTLYLGRSRALKSSRKELPEMNYHSFRHFK